ncbi:MAG: YHS domain-containing protein [Nitrososphaerota archaeon]
MTSIDPVCKMKVDEINAKYKSRYMDKDYYFCSKSCKDKFDKEPKAYLR